MKTPDTAKEYSLVLREAASSEIDGYYTYLEHGGKCDPAEERWIDALTAGAVAIEQVAVLESRLAQAEQERDSAVHDLAEGRNCEDCKHSYDLIFNEPCSSCIEDEETKKNWEWRGVVPENTKEEK